MSNLTELKQKYNDLEGRERKILLLGLILVTIFIIHNFIYNPMHQSINKLRESNANKQELLVWMNQSVASIKASSSAQSTSNKRRGRSLNVIINTSASSAKINISRSQPRDNNQYQIWIDQVVFNELLNWLNILQTDYGIYVSTINLGTTDNKGQVRVNLTFQDSGS
jgi:general secretion pathway protein M